MLILPGLSGTSSTNYATHFADEAAKKGCVSVAMNYRGTTTELLTTRMFCATDSDDLDFVVKHIKSLYPCHRIFAIGFSLGISTVNEQGVLIFLKYWFQGGMLLVGYLAKNHQSLGISNAFAISPPFNAYATLLETEKPQYIIFNKALAHNLKCIIKKCGSLVCE